jgi:hypothetical protein
MRRVLSDLLYGTFLAAAAGGVSCLLALVGYGRPYYLSVFLPIAMLGYLLIAWVLHLRGDRFLGSPSTVRGASGKEAGGNPGADGEASPGAKRALLWAAVELGVAASLLYALWGIGASYHG